MLNLDRAGRAVVAHRERCERRDDLGSGDGQGISPLGRCPCRGDVHCGGVGWRHRIRSERSRSTAWQTCYGKRTRRVESGHRGQGNSVVRRLSRLHGLSIRCSLDGEIRLWGFSHGEAVRQVVSGRIGYCIAAAEQQVAGRRPEGGIHADGHGIFYYVSQGGKQDPVTFPPLLICCAGGNNGHAGIGVIRAQVQYTRIPLSPHEVISQVAHAIMHQGVGRIRQVQQMPEYAPAEVGVKPQGGGGIPVRIQGAAFRRVGASPTDGDDKSGNGVIWLCLVMGNQ